ncbi:MAG TPA: hypothetical protein VGN64_02805 [Dyadobacter sp.]|jgi:hypothetical protein|nr:hypothetical protein [Dyadobacter sp.]
MKTALISVVGILAIVLAGTQEYYPKVFRNETGKPILFLYDRPAINILSFIPFTTECPATSDIINLSEILVKCCSKIRAFFAKNGGIYSPSQDLTLMIRNDQVLYPSKCSHNEFTDRQWQLTTMIHDF